MTPKRAKFVTEYLIDLNATQAATRAGFSKKTAYSAGERLLRDVEVRAAINKGKAKHAEESAITAKAVLAELKALAHSCVTHYQVDTHGNVTLAPGAPPDAMQAVQSIKRKLTTTGSGDTAETTCEVEIKLWDKPGPLKLAGRHVDLHGFADRVEVTGKGGGPVVQNVHVYTPENGRRT